MRSCRRRCRWLGKSLLWRHQTGRTGQPRLAGERPSRLCCPRPAPPGLAPHQVSAALCREESGGLRRNPRSPRQLHGGARRGGQAGSVAWREPSEAPFPAFTFPPWSHGMKGRRKPYPDYGAARPPCERESPPPPAPQLPCLPESQPALAAAGGRPAPTRWVQGRAGTPSPCPAEKSASSASSQLPRTRPLSQGEILPRCCEFHQRVHPSIQKVSGV